jgi:hypothetical protein
MIGKPQWRSHVYAQVDAALAHEARLTSSELLSFCVGHTTQTAWWAGLVFTFLAKDNCELAPEDAEEISKLAPSLLSSIKRKIEILEQAHLPTPESFESDTHVHIELDTFVLLVLRASSRALTESTLRELLSMKAPRNITMRVQWWQAAIALRGGDYPAARKIIDELDETPYGLEAVIAFQSGEYVPTYLECMAHVAGFAWRLEDFVRAGKPWPSPAAMWRDFGDTDSVFGFIAMLGTPALLAATIWRIRGGSLSM